MMWDMIDRCGRAVGEEAGLLVAERAGWAASAASDLGGEAWAWSGASVVMYDEDEEEGDDEDYMDDDDLEGDDDEAGEDDEDFIEGDDEGFDDDGDFDDEGEDEDDDDL